MKPNPPDSVTQRPSRQHLLVACWRSRTAGNLVALRNLLDDAFDNASEPTTRAWLEKRINELDKCMGAIR